MGFDFVVSLPQKQKRLHSSPSLAGKQAGGLGLSDAVPSLPTGLDDWLNN